MSETMRGEMFEMAVKKDLVGAVSVLRQEIARFNQALVESKSGRPLVDPSDLVSVEFDPQFWTSPATFNRVLNSLKNKISDQVLYDQRLESERDVFMSERQHEEIKNRIANLEAEVSQYVDLNWLKEAAERVRSANR